VEAIILNELGVGGYGIGVEEKKHFNFFLSLFSYSYFNLGQKKDLN
jgi:hypothetical protein